MDRTLAFIGSESTEMRDLLQMIKRREQLIERCPPERQWIDCHDTSCVGVGYRGEENIMCFICERQVITNFLIGMLSPLI